MEKFVQKTFPHGVHFHDNKELSKEEWEMWQSAITIHHENGTPLLIPDFIDIYEFEKGDFMQFCSLLSLFRKLFK